MSGVTKAIREAWHEGWPGKIGIILMAFTVVIFACLPFVIAASVAEQNAFNAKCESIGGQSTKVRNVKTSTRYCVKDGLLVEVTP